MEYVKIEGSFIRGLADRPDDQALVKAMGQIAKAFGKKTVAERVESGAVLNLLAIVPSAQSGMPRMHPPIA